MKVGIVTQWYPPEPEFIASGLAQGLAARGHEVRVLTGFPNYPGGRIYPGFRQRWCDESVHGLLTVRRVPLYPSHDNSSVRRIGNYLSFAGTSTVAALRHLAGVDVLYVYHPPATAWSAAAALNLVRRIPAVLHVQDLWPESVTASTLAPSGGTGRLLHRGIDAVMRRIYRSAAGIAVIAPAMAESVVAQGADRRKVRVVYNWTDEDMFRPVEATERARQAVGGQDRCVIMHAGNIGPFQNVAGAIRAAASVPAVDLVFVGSGIEEESARALSAELGAANVRFLGRHDPSAMAPLYAAADYQLISLRDLPIFRGTIPSKLQSALSCGAPVVGSVAGDCADFIERNMIGIACPPEDWRALADGFAQAAAIPVRQRVEMGQRARESYQAHMSRRAGIDALEEMLVAAAGRAR